MTQPFCIITHSEKELLKYTEVFRFFGGKKEESGKHKDFVDEVDDVDAMDFVDGLDSTDEVDAKDFVILMRDVVRQDKSLASLTHPFCIITYSRKRVAEIYRGFPLF